MTSQNRSSGKFFEVVTPEGVPLKLEVAMNGDRVAGFLLDCVLQTIALVLFYYLFSSVNSPYTSALFILVTFFLRNWYFIFFEIRWQGTTPGKSRMGLRVINRGGGSLSTNAIFVRNLMREIEFYIPLTFIYFGRDIWPTLPSHIMFLVWLWMVIFLLFPMFNENRLRIGDLVGGTMVVQIPKNLLLDDLSSEKPHRKKAPKYTFSSKHLATYGRFELQTLEELLRNIDKGFVDTETLSRVCWTIRKKIQWKSSNRAETINPEEFLRSFYTAQRAHLEHQMLMGKKKEFKS